MSESAKKNSRKKRRNEIIAYLVLCGLIIAAAATVITLFGQNLAAMYYLPSENLGGSNLKSNTRAPAPANRAAAGDSTQSFEGHCSSSK